MRISIINHKFIHCITFGLSAFLCICSYFVCHDLFKDCPTIFSTIGFFITFYGMVFAIIEVIRVKSVSQYAAEKSNETKQALLSMTSLRDAIECESLITNMIDILHNQSKINSRMLSRITLLYRAQFSKNHNSNLNHANNLRVLTSYLYRYRDQDQVSRRDSEKAKIILSEMLGTLSENNEQKIAGERA